MAPGCLRTPSDGACGPVDSTVDWTLTETSGVTVIPAGASSAGASAAGIDASTPSMIWNLVSTVPRTSSTAATGLSSPVEVTMTVTVLLADAAGAPTMVVPANAVATRTAAAASRPL